MKSCLLCHPGVARVYQITMGMRMGNGKGGSTVSENGTLLLRHKLRRHATIYSCYKNVTDCNLPSFGVNLTIVYSILVHNYVNIRPRSTRVIAKPTKRPPFWNGKEMKNRTYTSLRICKNYVDSTFVQLSNCEKDPQKRHILFRCWTILRLSTTSRWPDKRRI